MANFFKIKYWIQAALQNKTFAAIQAEVHFDFFAVTAKFRNSSFNVIPKQLAGTAVKASCAS